jgi:4-diphosphocytidyl-2-C-methyl-D-erythritol kinase
MLNRFPMMHAYAKINLGLYVVARRPDGYHDIETVFCRIGIADYVTFAPSPDIHVTCSSPDAPAGALNICHVAAHRLQERYHITAGVHIHITKNIPVGAGLGGGSADAALVLRELPGFWGCSPDSTDLARIALEIGSDVPFFLGNDAAVGRGRGEILEHFHLDIPYTILVCNPNIHVATAWAYSRITPGRPGKPDDLRSIITAGMHDPGLLRAHLRNDFEEVVFEAHPEVRTIKERMLQAGAVFALMSGSGSTVYAFFPDAVTAQALAGEFLAAGYRISLTPPHFHG